MNRRTKELLIISLSARMFAQSARSGGWKPTVIDQFADSDTVKLSNRAYQIDFSRLADGQGEFQLVLQQLDVATNKIGLIYGSGVDYRIEFVEQLFKEFVVYGNTVEVLQLCYNPRAFFSLLDRLKIPFPDTCFKSPKQPNGWLIKGSNSDGGRTVQHLNGNPSCGFSFYYQKYLSGQVLSSLFLADGKRASIIGFNTQWVSHHDIARPFLFCGLINRVDLSSSQRDRIKDYVNRLVAAIGLKGLNSLDFILDREVCKIIELNPRPSASLALYDEDYSNGLISEHISACQGEMDGGHAVIGQVRATKVIYAPTDMAIPTAVQWPEWSVDRPFPRTALLSGQPLCSITASGSRREQVELKIQQREKNILILLSSR